MSTPLPPYLSSLWAGIASGTRGYLTTPAIGSVSPTASFADGFTLLNGTPLGAGGVPPDEGVTNGLLNLVTNYMRYQNVGGLFPFQSGLSAALGGYDKGVVLISNDQTACYVSLHGGNTVDFNSTPSSIGVDWAPWAGATAGSGKYALDTYAPTTAATFTGTLNVGVINPTILTVSAMTTGTIALNQGLVGFQVPPNTYIVSQASGTPGGVGTYVLSNLCDSTAGPQPMSTQVINKYVIALAPAISSYLKGQVISFKALSTNSGASVVDAGGGNIGIVQNNGTPLFPGAIQAGRIYTAVFDAVSNAFWISDSSPAYKIGAWSPNLSNLVMDTGTYADIDRRGSFVTLGDMTLWGCSFGTSHSAPPSFHCDWASNTRITNVPGGSTRSLVPGSFREAYVAAWVYAVPATNIPYPPLNALGIAVNLALPTTPETGLITVMGVTLDTSNGF